MLKSSLGKLKFYSIKKAITFHPYNHIFVIHLLKYVIHYWKSLISVFRKFFASINNIVVFSGRLGTRLSLYEVLRLSRYFLRSYAVIDLVTCEATCIYHVYN